MKQSVNSWFPAHLFPFEAVGWNFDSVLYKVVNIEANGVVMADSHHNDGVVAIRSNIALFLCGCAPRIDRPADT